jgi:cullin 3
MCDHLKETGRGLVMDPERQKDPVEWVQRLLQVRAGLPVHVGKGEVWDWLPAAAVLPGCLAAPCLVLGAGC